MESVRAGRKYLITFLTIIAVVAGAYLLWNQFSETGKARRWARDAAEAVEKGEKAYVEAMTADTYGGKTPQETLDLFVAALRTGDVELASKYFLLSTDSSDENPGNYLTHDPYNAALKTIYSKDKLRDLVSIVSRAVANVDQPDWDKNLKSYVVYSSSGDLEADITLRFNKYSQVWKIESL